MAQAGGGDEEQLVRVMQFDDEPRVRIQYESSHTHTLGGSWLTEIKQVARLLTRCSRNRSGKSIAQINLSQDRDRSNL